MGSPDLDPSGSITFPAIREPTSFYVPRNQGQGIKYAPRYVDAGMQIAEALVFDRSFTDEEVEEYFTPLFERVIKGMS